MMKALVAVFSTLCSLMVYTSASALSTDINITHIQTGGSGTGTAGQEFVAVTNSSNKDVNVSDWCVRYADYTYVSLSDLFCFKVAQGVDEVHMSAKSHAVIVSYTYPVASSAVTSLFKSSTLSLSGTRGHIVLVDALNQVVDTVAWDNKASSPPVKPETLAASAPAGGSMLKRLIANDIFVDTDNNSLDFAVTPSILPVASPLIDYQEPVEIIDLCGTLHGVQETMPIGYDLDEAGNCELISLDMCMNISRVQLLVPAAKMQDEQGNCYDASLDVCSNIDGFQHDIPSGYRAIGLASCKKMQLRASISITEVLPNVAGTDLGKEFIELYNAGPEVVDLSDYYLLVGKQLEKRIDLPDTFIGSGEYTTFLDSDLGFTLLNTTTKIALSFYDNSSVDEIIPYDNPSDDVSWALIDGTWQYTNNVTPNAQNKSATEVLGAQDNSGTLTPCPAGKYRHPLTNRCRNIEEDAVLASCDIDEYRNPETNRCRKIVAATGTLVPCAEDYERNPDTNRCRKITSESTLAACAEGYERNPETNRCRKVLATSTSAAIGNIESPESQSSLITSPYALAATAGFGAVGYGVYEWRTELANGFRRLGRFILKK